MNPNKSTENRRAFLSKAAFVGVSGVVGAGSLFAACSGGINIPGVKGDGIHDDTAGIQALLDSGASTVHLPGPPKHYLISKTLKIHSGQTLIVDRNAVIRLADHAHAHLLTNSDHSGGNSRITVIGGIWDGNNATQIAPYHQDRENGKLPYDPDRYVGMLFQFDNVTDLHIADLTFKDPEAFGFWGGNLHRFTIENITFDYNKLEPEFRIMCGVQIHGNSSHGRIVNLKGNSFDDMVALNTKDHPINDIAVGPITDIQVDGIWAEDTYRAVRLLSWGSPVKRIKISNIFGSLMTEAVYLSNENTLFRPPDCEVYFEDISISGIYTSHKPTEDWNRPPIGVHAPATVTNLTISDYSCTVKELTTHVVLVEKGAKINRLSISNASLFNQSDENIAFVNNQGTIDALHFNNVYMQSKEQGQVQLLKNTGEVKLLGKANVAVNGKVEK